MAIVVDIFKEIENKKSLPFEGFFIDTNIVIIAEDPFSKSSFDVRTEELNDKTTMLLARMKQLSYKVYTTYSVALEYYKYLQYNYYTTFMEKEKFVLKDFKYQRKNNIEFMAGWDGHMKKFKRMFQKKYKLYPEIHYDENLMNEFNFNDMDFGDHLIVNAAEKVEEKHRAIFTNDKDFYSIEEDIYLLTLDHKLIDRAKKEGKYFI